MPLPAGRGPLRERPPATRRPCRTTAPT
jgi:hypothetical protein